MVRGGADCGSESRALRFSLPSAVILTTKRCDCHYHALRFSLPSAAILTTVFDRFFENIREINAAKTGKISVRH